MLSKAHIKRLAAEAGFDLCGVARCRHLADNERHFRTWLDSGYSANLGYLSRNLDKRFDPSNLVEGARTVVVCAVNYKNRTSDGYPDGCRTKIASYACTHDYHRTIRQMLRTLFESLRRDFPTLGGRMFTDSAPILEKQFAVDAGLGWTGRQSLLVTPQFGTFVLLGELVLTEEADSYDSPLQQAGCGECRRCVDACPAGAILPSRTVDASRCISCATVEARYADGPKNALHGWIFGCDCCQSVCPYNRRSPYGRNKAFAPIFNPAEISEDMWTSMTGAEFESRFGTTPLMRSGLDSIKKNLSEK